MLKRMVFHSKVPKEIPIFLFLVGLCTLLALTTRAFASASNLKVLGTDAAAIGIMAVGMTMVIITGGIDLSVAAVLAFATLIGGRTIANGNVFLGFVVTLIVGTACGALNGGLVTIAGVPPIIATLGTLYILQAAATLLSGGQCIILERNELGFIGNGFVPLVIMLSTFATGYLALRLTRPGRHIYAIGGNEEAARLAGINAQRLKLGVYAASGVLASLAGLVMMGISSTFQANDALGYELAVIAAVVIGGTSITGGQGSIIGTLIGVGISTVLRNGAILVGLDARWAQAIIGAAIFLAVAADKLRKR